MIFNKAKYEFVHMDWGKPRHKHRLGEGWIESAHKEKHLEILVDKKLNMTQPCALTAQKANRILGCRSKEVILPFSFTLVRPINCSYSDADSFYRALIAQKHQTTRLKTEVSQMQVPFTEQDFDFYGLARKMMKLNQQNGQASEISILKENMADLVHICKDQLLP
ncbi:hypothetical protein BTVI_74649 [Pitangus sulphuratus]|nr:hypothetical protein BTVI_74649 [Pitangus sulphuratus]